MDLPKFSPGKKFTFAAMPPSGDALVLANLAQRNAQQGQFTAIVTADALDAQRLTDEMVFFQPTLRVALLPDWETLPYDNFSPHHDLISERLSTLWRTCQRQSTDGLDVLLVPASTALVRLAPPSFLAQYTFDFKVGQKLDESALKAQLVLAGYNLVAQVMSPGDYAVRGGLIDLFPMGSVVPYRVDLFGDQIDTIRTFDPDTQRSLYPVKAIRLLPGREFPMDAIAREQFRKRWREQVDGDPSKSRIYKDIGLGIATAGIEYYLPLFFDQPATLFDYLDAQTTVVLHGDIASVFQQFWTDTKERHRISRSDPERPVLAPKQLFLDDEDFFTRVKPYAQCVIKIQAGAQPTELGLCGLPPLAVTRGAHDPLHLLRDYLHHTDRQVLVIAESTGRQESLQDYFSGNDLAVRPFTSLADFLQSGQPIGLATAALAQGFGVEASVLTQFKRPTQRGLDLVTETELFAASPAQRRRRKQEQVSDVEALIKDLSELKVGDPVVHATHGIGRYRGLVNMAVGEAKPGEQASEQEFLHIEYADNATLYVPVSQLHLISRYTGVSADEAPWHKLGSGQWEKARRKAAAQVRDAAAELLNLYAIRASRQGHSFRYSAQDYEVFVNDFGFEETADQSAAIHAVVQDMISPRPMDRLVCGDVGFGKTEVALRAAFIATLGGKQVAFLAPTTLLAEQHYQTLVDRFSKWPVKVAEMSRFRTAKEVSAALKGLADGTIDIVVGTHKLLSKSTQFARLGLLVIDEEHRFGVRHKEAMKAMRADVDVLTLTATPIPRTLGMALEGLRDLSVIATAPQRRLAIKTFVREEGNSIIREAIVRELKRGGQVYFLHNEVATIENRRARLQELVPEARIAVAHGQLPERDLERIMKDFIAQRYNVLVCSTIIETGIDVPSANTIVISRADKFGLAQLHQLRGRVGRSHHQAYAYLLAPALSDLTRQANQRLEAITQMEELGSGFYLAMHDLEIRGAGEVLGENQSGNMIEVGFQLYNEMLAEAVRCLKEGIEPDLMNPFSVSTEINLHAPALLTSDYCPDVHVRLSFYKKLATSTTTDQVDRLLEEMVDRFGKPPEPTHTLVDSHRLRVVCQAFGIIKVDIGPTQGHITFVPNPPIEAIRIIELIQKNKHIKLAGNDKLRIEKSLPEPAQRAQLVRDIVRQLGQPTARVQQKSLSLS